MGIYGRSRSESTRVFIRNVGIGLLIAAVIGILVALGQFAGVGPLADRLPIRIS